MDPHVAAHVRRAAIRDHPALVQDCHAIGQPEDDVHVVLDDKDRERAIQTGDELGDPSGLKRRHARRRLVEQEHARPLRERDRELQLTALTVRKLPRGNALTTGETDAFEHRLALGVLRARSRTKYAIWSAARGDREANVVARGKRCEELRPLIQVRKPESRPLP